jgi:hypothetical protein
MPNRTADQMLRDKFVGTKHTDAAVRHFDRMVQDYHQSKWDDANAKAGKFVEAVLKALVCEAGETPAAGKLFKAVVFLDTMDKKTVLPDSLRLTIPRACRFVYEIASNRGARHDADEVEANEMDAKAALAMCSWILAEMISYSQKGMDLDEARRVVESLMKRRYPFMEDIDGRLYVDIAKGAREAALLILYGIYPKRMAADALVKQVMRHDYKRANAEMGVKRIRKFVDDDDNENLRLRNTGVRECEELIENSEASRK